MTMKKYLMSSVAAEPLFVAVWLAEAAARGGRPVYNIIVKGV